MELDVIFKTFWESWFSVSFVNDYGNLLSFLTFVCVFVFIFWFLNMLKKIFTFGGKK